MTEHNHSTAERLGAASGTFVTRHPALGAVLFQLSAGIAMRVMDLGCKISYHRNIAATRAILQEVREREGDEAREKMFLVMYRQSQEPYYQPDEERVKRVRAEIEQLQGKQSPDSK